MAVLTFNYGSETQTMSVREISRIQATEIKFLRFIAGHTILDVKRNNQIRQELKVEDVTGIINKYREIWKQQISRMGSYRFPPGSLNCVSRTGRKAWEGPRRDGPTSLEPEQTKQSKP